MIYKDEYGEASVSSSVADSTAFWWNPKRPDERTLWESKIELGAKFFQEIISHPVPLNLNTLKALKRSSLGLDLYLWLVYRTFALRAPQRLTWKQLYRQFGVHPSEANDRVTVDNFRKDCLREVEEDQDRVVRPELHDRYGRSDPASLDPRDRAAQSRPATKLISPFPASQRPVSGLSASGWALGIPPRPRIVRSRKSPVSTGFCDSMGFSTTIHHDTI